MNRQLTEFDVWGITVLAIIVLYGMLVLLTGCGGQIGDSREDPTGNVQIPGTLPAPKDPQCARVLTYADGLAASGCGVTLPVDLTDDASCIAAGDDLDACFADAECRLDVGRRLLAGCHGLVPWWPCVGAPEGYGACIGRRP